MQTIMTTTAGLDALDLICDGTVLPIIVDSADRNGVSRAAGALADDLSSVLGVRPEVQERRGAGSCIIVGTLGSSSAVDELAARLLIDVEYLRGHDEAFTIAVVDEPASLVICGSDRRGTIYGIYEISRQSGINPWHFWLNVPPKETEHLYAKKGVVIKEHPAVRWRGIFLNDEAPALTNWILNTYGTVKPSQDPPIPEGIACYGSAFYAKLFDLLLRLKANYLWPAMWNNAFGEDDALNAAMADEWGIIMGTSHQEPMTRAQQEWDRRYRATLGHWSYSRHKDELLRFWREGIVRNKDHETVVTIGLRGADDTAMGEESWKILEEIVAEQRTILSEEMGRPAEEIPQLWCLYKEVQQYYEEGMRVPDDVILLWSDDNWGNLRRLPTEQERKRSGGAGIYYHFDYHGDPRNYQWINTTQIAKIWDQMSLALTYGADRLWVVNVGHFKGQEYPISFFLDLAWQGEAFEGDELKAWSVAWCTAIFASPLGAKVSDLVERIVELNSRRKPELLYPLAYSMVNYREAEVFVASWQQVRSEAEQLSASIPPALTDAFDHLVLFPARASHLLASLYLAVGRNHLWARQGRFAANEQALLVAAHFSAFKAEIERYQSECAGGMWRGFADQPVLGYIDWNDPPANTLEHLYTCTVPDADHHRLGVAVEGSEGHWPSLDGCALPPFDSITDQRQRIEVFNRSSNAFPYRITAADPWVLLDGPVEGRLGLADEVTVKIDWKRAPMGRSFSSLRVASDQRYKEVTIAIEALRFDDGELSGFIEADRTLVINAIDFQGSYGDEGKRWQRLPLSGPFGAVRAGAKDARLVYECWFLHAGRARVTVVASPALNVLGEAVSVLLSLDDGPMHTVTLVEADYQVELDDEFWRAGVIANARTAFVEMEITSGAHRLTLWSTGAALLVSRIIVDLGGVRESLLGPPPSIFIPR